MCYTLTWKCVTLLLLPLIIPTKLMMPPKTLKEMKKKLVDVIYDRRKLVATKGYGFLEVRVYLGRTGRKYINVDKCRPDEWQTLASSAETVEIIKKCEGIITAMEVLEEEMNVENFNFHYSGEMKKPKEVVEAEKKAEESPSKKSFIRYMEMALEDEDLRHGSWKNKRVVIDAVKRYGKLNTYGDLTPAKIMDFDNWLHDGTRTDVTCSGYHKKIHKWVRQLVEAEEIEHDPYARVTIKHGKSKERTPLTENELKKLREFPFTGKLERVRDLFVFSAYTGLAYADTQVFDFDQMTISKDGLYYVDGSRVKTGTRFFTPILAPAMDVLKKYNFNLPHISNQKANDYLHVIEAQLGLIHSLTFHCSSHSKFFYLLNISELSILKNVTANDLETSYILFLSQLCNIQRTL